MAEKKKGFILYADLLTVVEKLVLNDRANKTNYAGELFYHILLYVNDKHPIPIDFVIDMAFEPIKLQLKRDLDRWEETRGKRSDAGKKSAIARRLQREQTLTNLTLVKSVEQTPTKPTVIVNDNVNGNVNGNVNDIVIVKEIKDNKEKVYSNEIHDTLSKCLKFFPQQLHPRKKESWLETLRLLNEVDKIPFETIIKITKQTREDDFWRKNFLSLTKLRKKQKDSKLPYIVVFNENFNKNGKSSNKDTGESTDDKIDEMFGERKKG